MEFNIRAGKQVAYKENGIWHTGQLVEGNAALQENGLFLPIYPPESVALLHNYNDNTLKKVLININDIFFDAFKLEDWVKDCKDVFFTKKEYIEYIESEDFMREIEEAYVSDGEYGYYPVGRYTRIWIEKQPFDYVVRVMRC